MGSVGIANTDITTKGGMASLHGEIWAALSDVPILKGEKIIVEAVSGLTVKVKKFQ